MSRPFLIGTIQKKENILTGLVQFNNDHIVFKDHFPGNPIVPGVMLLQIIREILQDELKSKLKLTESTEIKFLKPIVPSGNQPLSIYIAMLNENKIKAEIKSGNTLCFKMTGLYLDLLNPGPAA